MKILQLTTAAKPFILTHADERTPALRLALPSGHVSKVAPHLFLSYRQTTTGAALLPQLSTQVAQKAPPAYNRYSEVKDDFLMILRTFATTIAKNKLQ